MLKKTESTSLPTGTSSLMTVRSSRRSFIFLIMSVMHLVDGSCPKAANLEKANSLIEPTVKMSGYFVGGWIFCQGSGATIWAS